MGKPDYYIDFARQNVVFVKPATTATSFVPGDAVYTFLESGELVFEKATASPGSDVEKANYFGLIYCDPGQPSFLSDYVLEAVPIVTEGFCYIPNYQINGTPVQGDVLYLRTSASPAGQLQVARPTAGTNLHIVPVCIVMQPKSAKIYNYTFVYLFPNDYYRNSLILSKFSALATANIYAAPGELVSVDTSSAVVNVYLPLGSEVPEGSIISVRVEDASNLTRIYPQGSDTIDGASSASPVILTELGSYREYIWQGLEWQTRIKTDLITNINQDKIIYVGKHGNDSNDGETFDKAKLTLNSAITLAGTKSPSTSDRWVVVVLDAGIYTESVTFANSFVSIYAPKARIVGNVTLIDDTSIEIDSVNGTIAKSSGSGIATVRAREVNSGAADSIVGNSGTINLDIQDILVSTESALSGDANLRGRVTRIYISGSGGNAIDAINGCFYDLIINLIDASATGGDGILVAAGATVNLNVQRLIADDDAYNVTATGVLNLIVNSLTGDEVGAAADVKVVRPSLVSSTKTTAYTANPEETVIVDPSSAGFTVTFPAAPVAGMFVRVTNITTSTNVVTIDGGTINIEDPDDGVGSLGTTATLTGSGFSYGFLFTGTFWKVVEKW